MFTTIIVIIIGIKLNKILLLRPEFEIFQKSIYRHIATLSIQPAICI